MAASSGLGAHLSTFSLLKKRYGKDTHFLSKKLTEIGSSRQAQDPQRWRSIRPHSLMLKSRTTKI
nr:conserved hypothetical protein [Xenorhabdus nematophila str. Anatoliense]